MYIFSYKSNTIPNQYSDHYHYISNKKIRIFCFKTYIHITLQQYKYNNITYFRFFYNKRLFYFCQQISLILCISTLNDRTN